MKAFAVKDGDQIVYVNDLHGLAVFAERSEVDGWLEYYADQIDEDEAKKFRVVDIEITQK